MAVTIEIDNVIQAIANDDGTWTCDDPIMQKYLNIVAGKRAVKDKWIYVPDMAEAMLSLAKKVFLSHHIEVIKRDVREPGPEGTVY